MDNHILNFSKWNTNEELTNKHNISETKLKAIVLHKYHAYNIFFTESPIDSLKGKIEDMIKGSEFYDGDPDGTKYGVKNTYDDYDGAYVIYINDVSKLNIKWDGHNISVSGGNIGMHLVRIKDKDKMRREDLEFRKQNKGPIMQDELIDDWDNESTESED